MIVRIATDGQYDVPDELYEELNRLDDQVVEAVDAHDDPRFRQTFGELLELVRGRGRRLDAEELRESAVILPPPDITLAEAEREFTGEGLLPD